MDDSSIIQEMVGKGRCQIAGWLLTVTGRLLSLVVPWKMVKTATFELIKIGQNDLLVGSNSLNLCRKLQ